MRTVWRTTIPVDDEVHELAVPFLNGVSGEFLHVAARTPYEVEAWADVDPGLTPVTARYRVTGTGHEVPADGVHVGTAVAPLGLVWHLWRVP